ncbi:transposon Ty3-G Gag-Pol polyprotein [Elysia marginata]|uniref:Transposon Ty3-G Gag-Pol polyprotein n=1 Tax=Elysia marginata TaxID=1093978 RepID=A0AAV4EB65_9GAST|nr:transposon Ty3-G Gag-Pol polyprotein [Elysia marginata]
MYAPSKRVSRSPPRVPQILTPHFNNPLNKHGVEHHIVTHGPPTHAHARRLDKDKLSAAKAEFLKMEEMGIVCRSKLPWSSPLHVVPKSDGTWRPCGDYRCLNASTEDDRYPLPHIQDFTNHLASCSIFSKSDLIRGYHQIPMAPSIPRTAVVTPFGLWEFLLFLSLPTIFCLTISNRPNKKREFKNKKFGFGGQKKRSKYNTAESAADVSGFSARKAHGKGPGSSKMKSKNKRPGKSKRNTMRNRGKK